MRVQCGARDSVNSEGELRAIFEISRVKEFSGSRGDEDLWGVGKCSAYKGMAYVG